VQASYHSGERERSALFIFDAVGRYSLADDDEAKWLTGERQSTSKGPQPRESGRGGERRLSAVPDGDDLLTLSEGDEDPTDDLTAVVRAVRETREEVAVEVEVEVEVDVDAPAPTEPVVEPTPAPKRRTKRASVPSWDEIMFGKDD